MRQTMMQVQQAGTTKNLSVGRGLKFFLLYVVWLFVGTMFYAYAPHSNLGLIMGFYMAINIGYSIGFGFPAENYNEYLLFSSFYVIVGASFVAMALSFFADKISEDRDNWFTNLMQKQYFENAMKTGTLRKKCKAVYIQYSAPIRAVTLWMVWILAMTLTGRVGVKEWGWRQAHYFAISTCSTGGHYGLPSDSPVWLFGITALLMLLGVPVMAVGMASMATLFADQGDLSGTKKAVCEEVDIKELIMLQKFGLEDGDGNIDRAEFIILCMVRMGTDPNLIEFISDRFAELDEDGGGTLSINEITHGKYDFIDGKIVPTGNCGPDTAKPIGDKAPPSDEETGGNKEEEPSAGKAGFYSALPTRPPNTETALPIPTATNAITPVVPSQKNSMPRIPDDVNSSTQKPSSQRSNRTPFGSLSNVIDEER